jgi:hypothetical protein
MGGLFSSSKEAKPAPTPAPEPAPTATEEQKREQKREAAQRRARGIRQRGLLGSVATRGTAAEEQTTLGAG